MAATLLERLGYAPDSRLLIVNADDFGMCNAENVATVEGLDAGVYSSTTIMLARGFLERTGFADVVALADELGVLAPDWLHVGGPSEPEKTAEYWNRVFAELRPGVTEIYVHAGFDHPELRACCPHWQSRVADHQFFSSADAAARLARLGIATVVYRVLREAQRAS